MTLDDALAVLGPIRAVQIQTPLDLNRDWVLYLDGKRGATAKQVIEAAYRRERQKAGMA